MSTLRQSILFGLICSGPFLSGSYSPSQHSESDAKCDVTFRRPSSQFILSRKEKSKSVPHIHQAIHNLSYSSPPSPSLLGVSSPPPLTLSQTGGRGASLSPVPTARLSPNISHHLEQSGEHSPSPIQSPGSTRLSPIALAKSFFRQSSNHLRRGRSPHSSPRASPWNSPKLGRRKAESMSLESEFVHWWMEEVREGEKEHWRQVFDKEGDWVYFWHAARPI